MIQITCPHCSFSKQIEAEQLPPDTTRVNCPKCKQGFALHQQPPQATPPPERFIAGHHPPTAGEKLSPQAEVDALPKAGFWIRVVATLIDAFIVLVLQFLLGSLLALAGAATGGGGEGAMTSTAVLIQLFGFALSFAYYVFFTGYCGQTPGKIALRIKVIRRDGTLISYGRAAYREVPAKFVSGIIFGIGYLMVAFDAQKQGLHDRIADTYVIKL